MVKRGDIFRLGLDTNLYLMETTSQAGDIYARPFNPEFGGYGDLVLFAKTDALTVVGNVRQPEQLANFQYCTVRHRVDWRDQWTGNEYFVAEAEQSKRVIGRSTAQPVIRGESTLIHPNGPSRSNHQGLIDQLIAQGWQPLIERRSQWFGMRLKRPI